jgi:hypothetical protein
MRVCIDRMLLITTLAIFILTSMMVISSVSLAKVVAQMEHMQNNNATIETGTKAYEIYENSTLGIKLQHPRDWPVSVQEIGPATVIKFNSTRQSEMDTIPPVVLVSIGKLPPGNRTLADLTRINMAEAAKIKGFHLIESNATKLGGLDARKIVYSYSSYDPSLTFPLNSMDIWTVNYGKKYTFSFIDTQHEFTKQLPAVKKILDSLEIK